MVRPANTRAIELQTETSWEEWCAFLDAARGPTLDHNALVRKAREFRAISGWWAQEIAVAYEQHIGRRKPGQTSDGLFSASLSRTINGDIEALHKTWCDFANELTTFDGQLFLEAPKTSATPKRLYWRCRFADKSAAVVSMEVKSNAKVLVVVEHNKLLHETQIAAKKQAWSDLFATCFSL